MALCISGLTVKLREIRLSQKAQEFIQVSAKSTVPVLQLSDGSVIDESLDIMHWALGQHDPDGWRVGKLQLSAQKLINDNDSEFKHWLDRYKYSDRYPQSSQLEYRRQAERFLRQLEGLLQRNEHLLDRRATLADIAIMPFIRQFAGVEPDWFAASPYVQLKHWLNGLTQSELFTKVMTKYPFWNAGDSEQLFPPA